MGIFQFDSAKSALYREIQPNPFRLMHGRPRQPSRALSEADQANIAKYNKHKTAALTAHKMKVYNPTTLALTASLMVVNPDFYTVFNFRKEILSDMMTKDPAGKEALLREELGIMNKALEKQPKSYYAWYHRIWVLEQGPPDLLHELELCAKFLTADPRNFHCWNYRLYVADRAIAEGLATVADQLAFTTEKIRQNFSNYSAWHARSIYLPRQLAATLAAAGKQGKASPAAASGSGEGSTEGKEGEERGPEAGSAQGDASRVWGEMLQSEFELVMVAFAMEPDDQSAWLYHRWLLAQVLAGGGASSSASSSSSSAAAGVGSSTSAIASARHGTALTGPSLLLPSPAPAAAASAATKLGAAGETGIGSASPPSDAASSASAAGAREGAAAEAKAAAVLAGAGAGSGMTGAGSRLPSVDPAAQLAIVNQQLNFLRDRLLPLAPEARWVLTSVALLLSASEALKARQQRAAAAAGHSGEEGTGVSEGSGEAAGEAARRRAEIAASIAATFTRLAESDPDRAGYYRHVSKQL